MKTQTYLVTNGSNKFFLTVADKTELREKQIKFCDLSQKTTSKRVDTLLQCYDNKGLSYDQITIVFLKTKDPDIFGSRFNTFEAIGSSETGRGFYSHTNAQRGRHLGVKVLITGLTQELQNKLIEEISE